MWLDDDVQSAIEYQTYLDSLCGGCGRPRDECFGDDNSDRFESFQSVCHACRVREIAQTSNRPKAGETTNAGRYYGAREVTGGD